MTLSFDERNLAAMVERLEPEAVDALPFGAVHIDAGGVVRFYSKSEQRLSGSGGRQRLGLNFFHDIAPCMNTPDFRGRIDRALAAGWLDVEFGWVGDFSDAARGMRVRAQSAGKGGFWLFMQRDD